ncbi:hypothetical protein C1645_820959 [Glomus cerebriforme]|uniref:Restriction of telomere capping protein 4 C-terminal domain-containing protein n=1 Tax=Glomus cerebriforme TaxID=658196 RepID=A0A397T1S1_9GLOM|nr:hypothetical protein C1645_820959 [Glomus cerebriforme]
MVKTESMGESSMDLNHPNFIQTKQQQRFWYLKVMKYSMIFPGASNDAMLQQLNKMINFLMNPLLSKQVKLDSGFYICNVITGECIYWEYIWNSSIHDKCRHCHAVILFQVMQKEESIEVINETKKELVQYFCNKERMNPAAKNNMIYQSTIENSFIEIIRLYNIQGNKIFYPLKRLFQEIKDPFQSTELSDRAKSNLGGPSKLSAKPRITHKINLPIQSQSSDSNKEKQIILTLEQTSPLKPMDFIYEVLVPEVALRLIQEDYHNIHNIITLEDAREILIDSIGFGKYMHSNDTN